MEANGLEILSATQNKYEAPDTAMNIWNDPQKNIASNNAKAMNVLFCSLDKNEFSRIILCNTAYDIWHTLQVTHEGKTKLNKLRFQFYKTKFDHLK